ncbi:helix-turn-helix transcriptional regulator [Actinophytocola sp.]|uniref:helix-turn-helix domain-containing protein n=1 Tax=Actinophytocola sp. TaxID=1872138 RepID=UPI0025C16FDF|nr:helix-turn-helix transcriptional regulator [Actinophytocola sp.]
MAEKATKRLFQLGRELRKARERADLTQHDVARALGCGQGKIQKIEDSTTESVGRDDLEVILDLCRITGQERARLTALAGRRRRGNRTGRKQPVAFERLLDAEADATEILAWHQERIPGPLQSEHYMLKQFALDGVQNVVPELRRRLGRAVIFTVADPPLYQVVLSESSLHRMPGGRTPALVVDQAEHLLRLCDTHERLVLQILTFEADIPFAEPDFTILSFAGARADFAYNENLISTRISTAQKVVANCRAKWTQLHQAALSPDDSKKFLQDLVADTRAGWTWPDNE